MPEIPIHIGGRTFEVACQSGEEEYLRSAASMLDAEASVLVEQLGRVPEARMLLMSGLMLADKTAALEEQLRESETRLRETENRVAGLEDQLRALRDAPPATEKVEVPVIPLEVTETLAEIAARAEALAREIEEKAAG